jgi:hypothetical protein
MNGCSGMLRGRRGGRECKEIIGCEMEVWSRWRVDRD